ncbi:MAG: sigma 54-interacting transcriptional regulator [Candidatus Riflebacteria bacterium]
MNATRNHKEQNMTRAVFLEKISAELLLETMAEGAILLDQLGRIRLWNKAMIEMTGYSQEEVLGHTTEWLRAPECIGAAQISTLLEDAGHDPAPNCVNRCECMMVAKNGERVPIMVNARLLQDKSGTRLGVLQTLTDIRPLISLKQQIQAMATKISSESNFQGITGKSPQMQKVFRLAGLAAESEASVMVLGESGTGKELVASAIHQLSPRKKQALIKVNCGAIPETLLESELFGHEKGSFTGAIKKRTGRFEAADHGTIFLDEIGDVSPAMQVKLLRVLQSGEFERLGGETTLKVNVRVVAATNKDLQREVREGRFREDLYYRLRVFPIFIPPLRERTDDIPLLARHFVNKFSASTGRLIRGISREAMQVLRTYPWPGNVRELENAIEYAFVVCQSDQIGIHDLPNEFSEEPPMAAAPEKVFRSLPSEQSHQILQSPVKLSELLSRCGWNKAEAGRILGVCRTAVWKWMKKHRIPLEKQD